MASDNHQSLDPTRTSWHITWGTYGTRLHGGSKPTVDREHNRLGEEFVARDVDRETRESQAMRYPGRLLSDEQRAFLEKQIPAICLRGGWTYRIAAAEIDHVHVLCDIVPGVHGEKVRRLLKRWTGQALNKDWPLEKGSRWWAVEGSNRAVRDKQYLNNVYRYIRRQRFNQNT